ncbi:MAG: ComEC/Rec2 family competence protein, partial [Patescibacteria group bacterium]
GYFERLSVVSPLTNLLVVPLIPLLMGIGLIGIIGVIISTSIGAAILWLGWPILTWIIFVSQQVGSWPQSTSAISLPIWVSKGYEYLIKALPQVLERHPNTKLMLIGETHPVIFRQEGESYRRELEELVDDLKLSRQVTFINKYLALDQLINYLVASDIYVTPYLNLHQITSGTLAYAIGAGRACVSTPYLYAQEVFNEGRGLLIEPRDANELAEKIIYLLDKPKIRREMMQRAYAFGRGMIWSRVGLKYLELFRLVADRDDV